MTNKHIYCFTGDKNDSSCTSIIEIKYLKSVESSGYGLGDKNTIFILKSHDEEFFFKTENYFQKNEWILKIKMAIENLKIIDEKDEIELDEKKKNELSYQTVF